jgi:hypothetical protein
MSSAPLTVEIPTHNSPGDCYRSPERMEADGTSGSPVTKVHQNDVPGQYTHDRASASSAGSDRQLVGSPDSISDRVFPIRSVVSVDHSQTPGVFLGRTSSDVHDGYFPRGPPPGTAGIEISNGTVLRAQRGQSFSEPADGRLLPQMRANGSRTSKERAQTHRRVSSSTAQSDTDRYGGGARMQLFNDAGSEKSGGGSIGAPSTTRTVSTTSHTPGEPDNTPPLVTVRFKHIMTAEGHAVITGRDGETLQRCEDEP